MNRRLFHSLFIGRVARANLRGFGIAIEIDQNSTNQGLHNLGNLPWLHGSMATMRSDSAMTLTLTVSQLPTTRTAIPSPTPLENNTPGTSKIA